MAALRSPRRLKTELLAGLVVALALIPEAISFSLIAGVDPRLGLFAAFTIAVTIAVVGGRPAMISAATVASLDAIEQKYATKGKRVTITGLNDASAERHGRLTGQLGAGH